ncbi:MAG: AAA family ATPase [Hyphomicrobiaceae bacterium]
MRSKPAPSAGAKAGTPRQATQIWAFVNGKGGVGKTTTVLNFSIEGHRRGLYAAVLDLDGQKSAERWAELRAELTGEQEPVIVHGASTKLKDMLDTVVDEGADLVLIDTPGSVDRTMLYAAEISDIVILPTRSSVLDQAALADTLDFLGVGGKLGKCIVLLNATGKGQEEDISRIREIAKSFGVPVAAATLADLPVFRTSLAKGRGVVEAKGKAMRIVEAAFEEIQAHRAHIMKSKSSR